MMAIEKAFGPAKSKQGSWQGVIVLRHGLGSSSAALANLEQYLQTTLPAARTINTSYNWKKSVLLNGALLAEDVHQLQASWPVILVGHSMGGLVSRVALAALYDPAYFKRAVKTVAGRLGYAKVDVDTVLGLSFLREETPCPVGLVTLATPNSGAVLSRQLSMFGRAVVGLSRKLDSVVDLTTERLFSFMQFLQVSGRRVLTVSGSSVNRFNHGSGGRLARVVSAAADLETPHDSVVEDRSVDLHYSVLPNELVHTGSNDVLHLRAYHDCTRVDHSSIYDDQGVRQALIQFLLRC